MTRAARDARFDRSRISGRRGTHVRLHRESRCWHMLLPSRTAPARVALHAFASAGLFQCAVLCMPPFILFALSYLNGVTSLRACYRAQIALGACLFLLCFRVTVRASA